MRMMIQSKFIGPRILRFSIPTSIHYSHSILLIESLIPIIIPYYAMQAFLLVGARLYISDLIQKTSNQSPMIHHLQFQIHRVQPFLIVDSGNQIAEYFFLA
jgi:hypothetical protein